MFPSSGTALILSTLALFLSFHSLPAKSPPCSWDFFSKTQQKNFTHCLKLATLRAEFGWNYHINQNSTEIEILFTAMLPGDVGWLAWGVNPGKKPQMTGTRAVIGIRHPNGALSAHTYNISKETLQGCRLLPSNLTGDVNVSNVAIENLKGTDYTLHATMILPPEYNISKLNIVWQVGGNAEDMEIQKHAMSLQNVDSVDIIDLRTGKSNEGNRRSRRHMRLVHGIMNVLGWGTMLPIGVIIARYLRKHPVDLSKGDVWYYSHVGCQIIGYTLGTVGWVFGLLLGQASPDTFYTHRTLGMIIFSFTTLQMMAIHFRPNETDNYRKYWDMYHHFLGYALIAVILTNIFHGIKILEPGKRNWKFWGYIGIIGVLFLIVLVFEFFSWKKMVEKSNQQGPKPDKVNPVNVAQSSGEGKTSGGSGNSSQSGQLIKPNQTII